MFSHTSRPRSRIWGTSVRKHWLFWFFWFFSLVFLVFLWFLLVFQWFWVFFIAFYWFFNGFLWFYHGFEQFLFVFNGFPYGFALFWVVPFGFSLFVLVSVLVLKEKPKENYWKTNPSRLRDLSGASFWASPSSGLLGSSGWLWPPPSSLSVSCYA